MTNKPTILNQKQLLKQRRLGAHGTPIGMHRALRNVNITPSMWLTILLLPFFVTLALWYSQEMILNVWKDVFTFWMDKLGLIGGIAFIDMPFIGDQMLSMPYPNLLTTDPSPWAIQVNFFVCSILFLLSLLLYRSYLPLMYLFRAILILQIATSVFYYYNPEGLPYALGEYLASMMMVGLYIIFLVSPIFALIYYVFDFSLWRKFIATAVVLAYFIALLPLQYMAHALIISEWGMLFMPTLYLLFGALLDVLMLVSWYSIAMVWRSSSREAKAIIQSRA